MNIFFWFVLAVCVLLVVSYVLHRWRGVESFKNTTTASTTDREELMAKLHDITFNYAPMQEAQAKAIKRITGITPGSKVLDAYVRTGHLAEYFKELGRNFYGVSESHEKLKRAKIRAPRATYVQGDIQDRSLFPALSFTQIIAINDAIYRYKPELRQEVINNFYYWLRPGGWLVMHVVEDPTNFDPSPREFTQAYNDDNDVLHGVTHFKQFSHDFSWEPNVQEGRLDINETYEFDGGKEIKNHRTLWIDQQVMTQILDAGFVLKEVSKVTAEDISEDLYYFQKAPGSKPEKPARAPGSRPARAPGSKPEKPARAPGSKPEEPK